jgi:hypothetical protein
VPIPASYGFPGSVDQNLGRIDNWGWEAQLSARVYENDMLSFDLDLAADYTDNEIKDLGAFAGTTSIRVGYPYPNLTTPDWVVSAEACAVGSTPAQCPYTNAFTGSTGVRFSGMCDSGIDLDPGTPGDPNAGKYGLMPGGTPAPCQTIPNLNVYAGRSFATHTFRVAPRIGLLDNQLQIFALAEGQYGRTSTDNGHQWGHIYNNSLVSRLENDPVWLVQDRVLLTGQFGWHSTFYDADFWKLREVGARYTIPQSLVERTGAERASIAFSARNFWTIWVAQKDIYGHPVTDPEYGTPTLGGDGNYWEVPALTSLSLTLRVTF